MLDGASVPVVIIGFRTARDIRDCLFALSKAAPYPSFGILICENGGSAAYDDLLTALTDDLCIVVDPSVTLPPDLFRRASRLQLTPGGPAVIVGEAVENLGYAGGINACISALEDDPTWTGLWILNPDTAPEPDALAELVSYAERRGKGMVGSRLMYTDNPDIVRTRGLRWRKLGASTMGIDNFAPVLPEPDPDDVEARIDSPSGASFYISRACVERIGPMDERYFLYYEDLDWGLRAKAACGIGYAYHSVVPHIGGSSIGSSQTRAGRSRLAVYLDFRNKLIFVRTHHPGWFAWTTLMAFARASEYLAVGAVDNFRAAVAGTIAGLKGEYGRPDHMMAPSPTPGAAV